MNESALPEGSGLPVPVDLTDDDPPNGAELSAPSAKKSRLVPKRKRARVVTAVDSANSAATEKSTPAEDSLMDVETLTSATEFRLTVNEWLADIDAEETQAAGFNLGAYTDSPAVVKAPLSSIFGPALLPLLDDDTVDNF
ncbi:TPA: hypothetical protein ACH3X1_012285 [Trebouxia sp. C0004]